MTSKEKNKIPNKKLFEIKKLEEIKFRILKQINNEITYAIKTNRNTLEIDIESNIKNATEEQKTNINLYIEETMKNKGYEIEKTITGYIFK